MDVGLNWHPYLRERVDALGYKSRIDSETMKKEVFDQKIKELMVKDKKKGHPVGNSDLGGGKPFPENYCKGMAHIILDDSDNDLLFLDIFEAIDHYQQPSDDSTAKE